MPSTRAFTADLARQLNVPPLGQFGLTADRFAEWIALARKSSSMRYNPVTLSDEALAAILEAAL